MKKQRRKVVLVDSFLYVKVYVIYILAALWGLGDAVWQTQVFIMIMNFKI